MSDARVLLHLAMLLIAAAAHAQLRNAAEPLPGITTAGQPDAPALRELAEQGFVAVIDLRTPEENRGFNEREIVEELGMTYVQLPISGSKAVDYENAAALDAILSKAGRPVLIHCASANRAGALLAMRQRLNGAGPAEALATGIEAGMTSGLLRSTVEQRLAEPPPQ